MMKKAAVILLALILLFIGAAPAESGVSIIRPFLIGITGEIIKWAVMGTVIYFTCKFWYTRDKKKSEREQDRQDG